MIKLLQIMPLFELAGAQTMCENLVNEIVKNKNIDITIITFFNNHCEIIDRLEANNINVIKLNKHKGFDVKIIFKLIYYFNKIKPNVIHTHLSALQYVYPAYLCTKNHKEIKLIHTIHNEANKENKKRIRLLQKKLFEEKKVIPVAISDTIQETVCREYKIKKEDVPIIYNSIDLSNCIQKKSYDLKYQLLNIGRITKQKNQEELLEIFNEFYKDNPQFKLVIVGAGPLEDELQEKINILNLNNSVKIINRLDSCYKILHESDCFLMTSEFEGLPMTILEALGTGTPIVTYAAGGIADIVLDGYNGMIANNKEEFIQKMKLILDNIELRKTISQNEIISSKKYSSKNMAELYMKLYV